MSIEYCLPLPFVHRRQAIQLFGFAIVVTYIQYSVYIYDTGSPGPPQYMRVSTSMLTSRYVGVRMHT